MNTHSTNSLFSFQFSILNLSATVHHLMALAKAKVSAYVCVANVHMLVEAKKDAVFNEVLQQADVAVLDGMPLCWSMRLLQGIKADRIAGRHLMHALLLESEVQLLPVYIYGSEAKVLKKAHIFFNNNYPLLKVSSYSPPFRALTRVEDDEIILKIKESGAALVFVALGCPKQEKWMASMKGKIPAVMVGIGIALEVLTGQQKSTPLWMERTGLEWLFRLGKEPSRLFKRYLLTNSAFILLFSKEFIKIKFSRISRLF